MSVFINEDRKMKIEDIAEQINPELASTVKRISDKIDPVLLAFEGLEVHNYTAFDLKVRLVLVRATGRFFFYIENTACECHPTSYKEQQKEYLEGYRVIPNSKRGAPFDKIPIVESEF